MKVIGIYDKNSNLKCFNKKIFTVMRKYLANFPDAYSELYYHNLEGLRLFKVDKIVNDISLGKYDPNTNVIMYVDNEALGHELFHVASNDLFYSAIEGPLNIEQALIEGMTEYLFMDAYDLDKPNCYHFEVFCVAMLAEIDNLFRPYFIPSHDYFISLFKNKNVIYSLLYALDTYHNQYFDYLVELEKNGKIDMDENIIAEAIKSVIDNLISIELSIAKNDDELRLYSERFMDLITISEINDNLSLVYPGYSKYAFKQVNKRIRCR